MNVPHNPEGALTGQAATVDPGLGPAYADLRQTMAAIQSNLGDSDFAKHVVRRAARGAFPERYRDPAFEPYTDALVCTPMGLRDATSRLRAQFSILSEPATHRGPVVVRDPARESPGDLVLRDAFLVFETPSASVLLARAYPSDLSRRIGAGSEQWAVSTFDEMSSFIREFGGNLPSVGISYAKSRAGAVKSLLRIARENLGVDLAAVK